MKFQRTYSLTTYSDINNPTPDLTIAYPFTIKFSLQNNFCHSANVAHFLIYNLGEQTRASIYRDLFDLNTDYRYLIFAAGYSSEPNIPIVFQGDIRSAFSYRQGPDWITEIEAWDGQAAMQKSQINLTVPSGFNMEDLINQAAGTMDGITLGSVGSFETKSSRGRTLSGNTWDLLVRMMAQYNTQPFINKGVLHVVNQDEYVADSSALTTISSDTGLIGTPRRAGALITATMIFEPRVEPGQKITLVSQEQSINTLLGKYADYKVVDVAHTGTISGSVGGDALTNVTFLLANQEAA